MLDYGKDGNKYRYMGPYPNKSDYTVYYAYDKGKCVLTFGYGINRDAMVSIAHQYHFFYFYDMADAEYFRELKKYIPTIEVSIHDDYKLHFLKIREITDALEKQWYTDIYEYYGVDPNSRLISLIMSKAYEDGHSLGFYEIETYFSDYLEFADDILKIQNAKGIF